MGRYVGLLVLACLAVTRAVPLSGAPTGMPLTIVSDQVAAKHGAACLDGTPPGYYFEPASDPSLNTTWVLYFKGGGACFNEQSCKSRSMTSLGSSSKFPPTLGYFDGPVSADASVNDLAGANRVIFMYCDGASFAGMRAGFTLVDGTKLYFRGRYNIDAILDDLNQFGLGKATDVLLSGGSAGGLATYLHADYIRGLFPNVRRFRAAPISGFFLRHNDVDGQPLFPEAIKTVYNMQNGTANQACLDATPQAEQWTCMFAQNSYKYIETPIFPINSNVDAWQMSNIFAVTSAERKAWSGCLAHEFHGCSADEIKALNGYGSDFMAGLQVATLQKQGNGAFIHSCLTHVAAQSSGWKLFAVDNVTMREAFSKWWNSDNDQASEHSYFPCSLSTTSPHQCNPTCIQ